jgi:hypothetical protein
MINDVYSDEVGSNARIAKVLSATLQAVVADTANADPGQAFMSEYRDEHEAAQAAGLVGILTAYEELFLDMGSALFSLARFVAQKTGEDPHAVLGQLIRTYRKAADHPN